MRPYDDAYQVSLVIGGMGKKSKPSPTDTGIRPAKLEEVMPDDDDDDDRFRGVASMLSTLRGLVKIAGELDKEGKMEECEEIHKVIRKYIGQIRGK